MASDYVKKLWKMWTESAFSENLIADKKQSISYCATVIQANKDRYQAVGDVCGKIPYYIIGCIHSRESSFNFKTHLANGQSLSMVTTIVPKGLGPFKTWEEGAIAALKHMGFDRGYHWDIANALENLESYNGLGYKHMGLPSPYVWSMTNQYSKGKFTEDHTYNPERVDSQVGCAAILLELKRRDVELNEVIPV